MSESSSSRSNGHPGPAPLPKKSKLTLTELELNSGLRDTELLHKLNYHWETAGSYAGGGELIQVHADPFAHVEIKDFISQVSLLEDIVKLLDAEEIELHEKSSDLFKFRQSNDLVSVSLPEVDSLRQFFETNVLEFVKKVTDLPLNGKVDMFISDYGQTDFLLCHDDELESRRIAFILYLSKDWNPDYGGSLDLFSASEEIHPLRIVKSIIPSFNKFVFFNVGSTSFHQVAEVVADKRRLAVSGWFNGEPVPRPAVTFPSPVSYPLQEHLSSSNEKLEECLSKEYSNPVNHPAINASLEEFSIAKLKLFLRDEKHKEISDSLDKIPWEEEGQGNLCSFSSPSLSLWPHESSSGPSPTSQDPSNPISKLIQLFHSPSFLEFIEKISEFEILTRTRISSPALRRFQHKNYILLRTNNSTVENTDESEGEEWEIGPSEETDEEGEKAVENEDSSGGVEAEENSEEEGEPEEAEMEIDIVYYCGDFSWDESMGGQTVYADDSGQQLLTLTPEPNTLGVVVREKAVNSYVTYINCHAGKEKFYSFSFTIAGFKN